LSYCSSGNSFARSLSGPRRKVQIWAIIQIVKETPKLATTSYDVNSHEISRIRQREFSQGSAGNRENESAGSGPIDLKGNSQVARAGFVFYGQCGR
jgi:hypothetical protein